MRIRVVLAGTSAGVALSLGLAATPAFAATWSVVPSQSVTVQSNLGDLDLLSATDGWAVGGSFNGGLIERWNGTQWTIVASPDIIDHRSPNNFSGLSGVDALSATSAYAVGIESSYSFGDGLQHKLAVAERWNGTAWSTLAVPNPAVENEFTGVEAFSGTDVWALGRSGDSFFGSTLAMHWNGSSWSTATTPSPGTRDNVLSSVAATGPSDVWAVGYSRDLPYGNRARHPLVLHWNGQAWSLVPAPEVGSSQTVLQGVAALSPTDAWAVGYANGPLSTLATVLHWNGQAWSSVPAPALGTLDAVTALSANNIWVAGSGTDGLPYLANWRGTAWTITAAPSGGLGSTFFNGMATVGPGTVWAAGYTQDPTTGNSQPRIIRTTDG